MERHCRSFSDRTWQVLSSPSLANALQKTAGAYEDVDGDRCTFSFLLFRPVSVVWFWEQVQALEQAYDYWEKFQFDIIAAKVTKTLPQTPPGFFHRALLSNSNWLFSSLTRCWTLEPLNGGPRNIVPENGRRCIQGDYPSTIVATSYSRIPGALDNVARWSRWILARGRHNNEYDWHEHLYDFSFVLKQSDILPTSCQLLYLGLSLDSIRYRSKFRQDGTPYSHLSSWVLWRLTPFIVSVHHDSGSPVPYCFVLSCREEKNSRTHTQIIPSVQALKNGAKLSWVSFVIYMFLLWLRTKGFTIFAFSPNILLTSHFVLFVLFAHHWRIPP